MSSKNFNEKYDYIPWYDCPSFPKTLDDFLIYIDRCDDNVKDIYLKDLYSKAKEKLPSEDLEYFTKYMCYELLFVPDKKVQAYLNEIDIPKAKIQIDKKPRGGNYYLISNRQGVIYSQEKTFQDEKTEEWKTVHYDKPIIDVPFELMELYITQNEERFYDVKLGKEKVCLNKDDLLDYLQKQKNLAYVSGRILFDYVSIVLRAYEKEKYLREKRMYPAIGVFLDKKRNLVLAYPNVPNLILHGENGYQKRIIEHCEELGLDIDGDLAEFYYKLLHDDHYPENVRLGIAGNTITAPFHYVLKDFLDVFPSHKWIVALTGIGKSIFNELMYCTLYGIEMKSNDDVNSEARMTKMSTACTMAIYIDDIDYLDEKCLSYAKFIATHFKPRERMDNQKTNFEDAYTIFCGSANSSEYLSGSKNEPYRVRCLINTEFNQNDILTDTSRFEKYKEQIQNGKVFGFYALQKVIEFIESAIADESMSSLEKLKQLIQLYKQDLRKYLQEEKIVLVDSRRLTIYTLIYLGWKFWHQIFLSKGLKSDFLLNALDYGNNDTFKNFIKSYEGNLVEISRDHFINIINFFERIYEPKNERYYLRDKDNNPVLTTHFIHEYDKWAKIRGYDSLRNLTTIADMQMKVLRENIRATTVYLSENGELDKDRIYGLVFKIDELKKILNIEDIPSLFITTLKELYEDNDNVDLEKRAILERFGLFEKKYPADKIDAILTNLISDGFLEEQASKKLKLNKDLIK